MSPTTTLFSSVGPAGSCFLSGSTNWAWCDIPLDSAGKTTITLDIDPSTVISGERVWISFVTWTSASIQQNNLYTSFS